MLVNDVLKNKTRLSARDCRQLAWNALKGKGNFLTFIGIVVVQALATFGLLIVPLILMMLSMVFVRGQIGEQKFAEIEQEAVALANPATPISTVLFIASLFLFATIAIYALAFCEWGRRSAALATLEEKIKFSLWDEGYGHSWHLVWISSIKQLYIFLWSLLFIIPGIVKSLSYAMTTFVAIDHPDWSATQCIQESERLMRGHRWRFFCLQLSFIGWWIIAFAINLITNFGLGSLALTPYIETAIAAFYNARKANQ